MLTDKDCTAYDSGNTAAQEAVQYHGKRFVNNDVGKQQGDQNPMFSPVEQSKNSCRVLVLRLGRVARHDLEVDGVLAHQSATASVTRVTIATVRV